jgi:heptosyltransferase-2
MKILIVRFSSFGDIVQALPAVKSLHDLYPAAEIHWLTREDFSDLVTGHPNINKVITLDRKTGFKGFIQLLFALGSEKYTHVYDAHNNLRTFFLRLWARLFWWSKIVKRPKNRWKRFLFFKLRRRSVFKMPFRGVMSFIEPLKKWEIPQRVIAPPHLYLPSIPLDLPPSFVAIAPSAAWPNKRWPLEHWKQLIALLPDKKIVVLGGPKDTFCEELTAIDPDRVVNWAGKCSLIESCYVVKKSRLTISADTGILHAADQLGVDNIGLIGPTAFGYTSQPQSHILETELYCKPCSKDGRTPCVNPEFQKCMKDILPTHVADAVAQVLEETST